MGKPKKQRFGAADGSFVMVIRSWCVSNFYTLEPGLTIFLAVITEHPPSTFRMVCHRGTCAALEECNGGTEQSNPTGEVEDW